MISAETQVAAFTEGLWRDAELFTAKCAVSPGGSRHLCRRMGESFNDSNRRRKIDGNTAIFRSVGYMHHRVNIL